MVKPYYHFSFHTQDGTQLSLTSGVLKLMIHPQVGYVNMPDQKNEYLHINSMGFRGPEIKKSKETKKRIIVVGGSTAFGTGLDNDEQTFTALLQKKFENAEVINAAVLGHCSGQELTYLVTELIDLDPDLVIAFDGANDHFRVGAPIQKWFDINGADQQQGQLITLARLRNGNLVSRILNSHLMLYNKTYNILGIVRKGLISFAKKIIKANLSEEQKSRIKQKLQKEINHGVLDMDTICSQYLRNIQKMKQISEAYGAGFICILQPQTMAPSIPGANEKSYLSYREFRQIVKKHFEDNNIQYIDLNDHMDVITTDMFMDVIHLDEHGHQKVTDLLVDFMKKRSDVNPSLKFR